MADDISSWNSEGASYAPQMAVVGEIAADRALVEHVLHLSGFTMAGAIELRRFCADEPALNARSSPVLLRLTSGMDPDAQDLVRLVGYLIHNGIRAVVWADLDQLDLADAIIPSAQAVLLVNPKPVDLLIAIAEVKHSQAVASMFDNSKADDATMLGQMSEQLNALAQTLSRMASQDELAIDPLARDRPVSFRAAPKNAPMGFVPAIRSAEEDIDPRDIREIIRLRRLRDQFFEADLFGDPAWDIILDLMAARLEHRKVSVSSLCIAAAVPATTALRWIQRMTSEGWLERRADPHDARRVYIVLSDDTAGRMADYLRADLASRNR